MGPTWGYLGPTWDQLGPTWANLGPNWGQLGALEQRIKRQWFDTLFQAPYFVTPKSAGTRILRYFVTPRSAGTRILRYFAIPIHTKPRILRYKQPHGPNNPAPEHVFCEILRAPGTPEHVFCETGGLGWLGGWRVGLAGWLAGWLTGWLGAATPLGKFVFKKSK